MKDLRQTYRCNYGFPDKFEIGAYTALRDPFGNGSTLSGPSFDYPIHWPDHADACILVRLLDAAFNQGIHELLNGKHPSWYKRRHLSGL